MVKKQWHYEEEETSSGIQFSVYNEDGTRITEPYISEESARLIAVAPELLELLTIAANEACEVDHDQFSLTGHEGFDPQEWLEKALAAIVNARKAA